MRRGIKIREAWKLPSNVQGNAEEKPKSRTKTRADAQGGQLPPDTRTRTPRRRLPCPQEARKQKGLCRGAAVQTGRR